MFKIRFQFERKLDNAEIFTFFLFKFIMLLQFIVFFVKFQDKNFVILSLGVFLGITFICSKAGIIRLYKDMNYTLWYGFFIILGLLSLIWCLSRNYAIASIKYCIVNLLFTYVIINYATNVNKIMEIMKMYIVGALIMGLSAVYGYDFSGISSKFGENIGVHFNAIALTSAFAAVFSYYLCLELKKKIYLLWAFLLACVVIIPGSRKALLIMISGIIILSIIKFGIKRIYIVLPIIILFLYYFNYLINTNEYLYKMIGSRLGNLLYVFQDDVSSVDDASLIERRYYIELAIDLFKRKPILGWGIHNFAAYLERIGYDHVAYCHNNWLEVLSNLGIIGFVAYYSMYVKLFVSFVKNKRKELVHFLGIMLLLLLTVFEYGLVDYYMPQFQIIIAIIYVIMTRIKGEKKSEVI